LNESAKTSHPFPYQGSKRSLAKFILPYIPRDTDCLYEPFCGSGAISIASATAGIANRFALNDSNEPLMALWSEILRHPIRLASQYESLWFAQQTDPKTHFLYVRDQFNKHKRPQDLLYLLARIVKGAVRYSSKGMFNQSADHRRFGMRPESMRQNILSVANLLSSRAKLTSFDYRELAGHFTPSDLVYMDPPYRGTSFTRDHRYIEGLDHNSFVAFLDSLNQRQISFLVSYDGSSGDKSYGEPLPKELSLKHLHISAGRSSQATLLGHQSETVESLYVSPALLRRLDRNSLLLANKPRQFDLEYA
jgi:DNA adenine methylase